MILDSTHNNGARRLSNKCDAVCGSLVNIANSFSENNGNIPNALPFVFGQEPDFIDH